MTLPLRTTYLSRRVGLPPLVAQAAYDERVSIFARGSAGRGSRRTRLEVGRIGAVSDGTGYAPYRARDAVVVSGKRTWPVRLELLPWSDDDVEIGLRVVRKRFAPVVASDAYVAIGLAVLEELAAQMRQWADQPLRDALSDRPDVAIRGGR